MIKVAFTYYPRGGERTTWTTMPQVPAVGDSVGRIDDLIMTVSHVLWANDAGGWHAEVTLSLTGGS